MRAAAGDHPLPAAGARRLAAAGRPVAAARPRTRHVGCSRGSNCLSIHVRLFGRRPGLHRRV